MDQFDSSDSNRSSMPLRLLQKLELEAPLELEHGGSLPDVELAYETFGCLLSLPFVCAQCHWLLRSLIIIAY